MRGKFSLVLAGFLVGLVAAVSAHGWLAPQKAQTEAGPDMRLVVERMREVARLETLDVSVYKKVSFEPLPAPSNSTLGDLAAWAVHSVRPTKGRAIVFGTAHLGVDLGKLDGGMVRTMGHTVYVNLPPVKVSVEVRPGETEVIESNLSPAQLGSMMETARVQMEADVAQDAALKGRARLAAERTVRAFLTGAGFSDVVFAQRLPGV